MIEYLSREYYEQFKHKYGVTRYELIYTPSDRNDDINYFEAYNSDIRLRKKDFEYAQELLVTNVRFYRQLPYDYSIIDGNTCQKPTHQEYDFNTLERTIKYEEVAQDCKQITKNPSESGFIISFLGIEPNIQFNIDDLLKNIFSKHHLDITVRHQKEVLETLKADLFNLDLGKNAVLSLKNIRLEFIENTGYVVDSFETQYLMLK